MSLTVSTRLAGAVTVIDVEGGLVGDGVETLGRVMRREIRAGRTRLLLNLAQMSYCNSAGLGALVAPVSLNVCSQCATHYCSWLDERCPSCGLKLTPSEVNLVRREGVWKPVWGEMKLLQVSPRVLALLTVTRLHSIFEIFDDEAAALRSFETA